jgi:hypothetical protein
MDIPLDDGRSYSPLKLTLVCAACVLAPWIWGVWAMPPWVAAVSLVFSVLAVVLLVWLIRNQIDSLRAQSMAAQSLESARKEAVAKGEGPLRDMLAQWLAAAQLADSGLQQAQAILAEVNEQSEVAGASIGKSFRQVMSKSTQQMDDALKLLKASSDGQGGSTWLSLPDFIAAYEKQLDTVTGRMMDFSKASEEMSQHQDIVREHSLAIDEMLDELRNMAARIRKLALDSTVAVNRDATADTRWFIEIADRIRETSTSAHDLTRRMRDGLEKIRVVMSNTYDELSKSSDNVRMAAVQAKVDVSQLNIATMEKAREVTQTLEKITSLGKEVQRDINQIVVAMQYQDINRQKIEQVRSPLLSTAAASIAESVVRTRAAGVSPASAGNAAGDIKVREDLVPGRNKAVDVELF